MAMENMLLTDENSEMLRVCLECKVLFKAIHENYYRSIKSEL